MDPGPAGWDPVDDLAALPVLDVFILFFYTYRLQPTVRKRSLGKEETMVNTEQLRQWHEEVKKSVEKQPSATWTVARMKLIYAQMEGTVGSANIDVVTAAGACPAQVVNTTINERIGRIEVTAGFAEFDLRGRSSHIGDFQILLQKGQRAHGVFRQRHAHRLFPFTGEWTVPFLIRTRMGDLIPRPTDTPVVLRAAEPGEFAIPPIGTWFEKWDPISLVAADQPDGPTVAIVDHAMHVMLNEGREPARPPFYWKEFGK